MRLGLCARSVERPCTAPLGPLGGGSVKPLAESRAYLATAQNDSESLSRRIPCRPVPSQHVPQALATYVQHDGRVERWDLVERVGGHVGCVRLGLPGFSGVRSWSRGRALRCCLRREARLLWLRLCPRLRFEGAYACSVEADEQMFVLGLLGGSEPHHWLALQTPHPAARREPGLVLFGFVPTPAGGHADDIFSSLCVETT
jgi:hypothetical protein